MSNRVIYIHLDQHGEPSVGIPDTNGKNPLLDKRVREALSIAIDRKGIDDKIMEGVAVPAGDLLPYPMGGTRKDTPVDPYDPAKAKKLLAEAGYPNGFSITLGAPNGRYINDLKIAQAVASMWSRIGVKTEVDAAAPPVFFKNRDSFKYSRLSRRLGRQHRRAQQRPEGAARHARPAQGHGHDQLRPLLQQGDGRQAGRGAGAPTTTPSARRCWPRRARSSSSRTTA